MPSPQTTSPRRSGEVRSSPGILCAGRYVAVTGVPLGQAKPRAGRASPRFDWWQSQMLGRVSYALTAIDGPLVGAFEVLLGLVTDARAGSGTNGAADDRAGRTGNGATDGRAGQPARE